MNKTVYHYLPFMATGLAIIAVVLVTWWIWSGDLKVSSVIFCCIPVLLAK